MKKIISVLLILIGLYSCSGLNAHKVKEGVLKKFPNNIAMESPPGQFSVFIIIDKDSTLWYVQSRGFFTADKMDADSLYSFKKRIKNER